VDSKAPTGDWLDLGGQRNVAFEAAPPGRYTFRVLAANGDGVWNETGASLAVEVLPHVWETKWFRGMVVALASAMAIALGWIIAKARMRGRLMRLELQTLREKERSRIAQDLHDDLGASLTEISMLAHLAAEEEMRSSETLPEIAAKAQDLVEALDEIVWAVNPRHDTVASLADYLSGFAAEFLEAAGIALRLDIPRDLPSLPLDAEQRHSVFLTAREALNNTVKHSGAKEARLQVRVANGLLHVVVADDGRGLSGEDHAFSEGLRNMRERLSAAGGECRIESPGRGTRVEMTLPLHAPR
jgi:signal transduction histidine kinase